jgi:tetratricopeptide (TPR) repeat protein
MRPATIGPAAEPNIAINPIIPVKVDHDGETSLRLLQEANERDPSNTLVYDGWGSVLEDEKDYDGAIAKYQQAVALDPKYAYAYDNWGDALNSKRDYNGAIAKYQRAVAPDPSNQNFRADFGSRRDREGEH